MKLKGRTALVTGGARRIGRAIALGLAEWGVNVAVHYQSSGDAAKQTVADLKALGLNADAFQADFRDVTSIDPMVAEIAKELGPISILINNAAVYDRTPFGETTEAAWDRLLDINLKAAFFVTQAVSRRLLDATDGPSAEVKAKIIMIADIAGLRPWSGYIPYSVSKAGLIAMSQALAKQLAPLITVNAIAIGTVLPADDLDAQQRTKLAEQSLLKRIGDPADVTAAVRFLLEGSDFITGETLVVDGGRQWGR